jgi:hypothetical protein
MSVENIPTILNKELFEKALENKFKHSVKVIDFQISAGSKKGDNYTSDIYRVKISYESQGRRSDAFIIVKYMIDREEVRKVLLENFIVQKEKEMYEKVLPRINQVLGEKCSADCYYIVDDPPAFILEDLKAIGFDIADRQKGLDLVHCKVLLKKLGKFHAASIILNEKEPGIFKSFNEGMFRDSDFIMEMFESAVERVTEIARKWNEFESIVKKLENIRKNLKEKIYRCVKQPSDFPVLTHGDVWTNNFMFQYKNGVQSPIDVRFVSFILRATFVTVNLGLILSIMKV